MGVLHGTPIALQGQKDCLNRFGTASYSFRPIRIMDTCFKRHHGYLFIIDLKMLEHISRERKQTPESPDYVDGDFLER